MNKLVDCVGEMCPVPVVKAQIQYKKLSLGDSITIITDHSCTSQSLKEAFKKFACEIDVQEENGMWEIIIKKVG